MTKYFCLIVLLAGLVVQDARADDRVLSRKEIYRCRGSQAVGYKNGSWSPMTFDTALNLRIEETKWASGRRYWTVRVMYKDWTYMGASDRNDIEIFQAEGGPVGTYFIMDESTGKFSFMDSFGYMTTDPVATAHMSIGVCRSVSQPGPVKELRGRG